MSAKYHSYETYSSTGYEFLEQIPSNWSTSFVGAVSDVIDPQPDHRAPAICSNGNGFPYVGIRDVNHDGTLNYQTARQVEESAVVKQENSFKIDSDDIIFCKVGTLGLPRKIKPHGRCALSATLVLVKSKKVIASQYLFYALDSSPIHNQTSLVATGSTRAALGIQQIRKFRIPYPEYVEQVQIANFLDYETAKIDTLIEKQQQLIKLLKEKRQAVISHAVTKGLNPAAPMKDSGVEWLGEVPEHWTVLSLGKITKSKCDGPFGSGLKSSHYTESGVKVVRLQNIKVGGYFDSNDAFIDKDYYRNHLRNHDVEEDDVLIAGLGDPRNPVGRACVAPKNIAPAMVKADCFRFRLDTTKAIPGFIAQQLSISAFVAAGQLSNGSTRARIPLNLMATRKIAICPLDEQGGILEHISSITAKYNELEKSALSAIELMKERRTALISAAVTGKIDVRNWQPENQPAQANAS